MSHKILLIQLSHSHIFKNNTLIPFEECSYSPGVYPLGLGYLSNVLKNAGYVVEFLDLWAHPENITKYLSNNIKNYDAVGVSFYVTQYNQLEYISKQIKIIKKEMPLIVGGPGAKGSYKILMDYLPIDFVVFEEAEISLINLLNEIFGSRNYRKVKGIAFKEDGGQILTNESQPYIKNLDVLEYPDRDCLDRCYFNYSAFPCMNGLVVTNIISGRGCPYNCAYCSKTFQGCRYRSIENIIGEIELLKDKYGVQAIAFNDELVITSKQRILELCEGIKKLNLKWGCQGRVNLVDEEILIKMRDAGCVYVGYGFENATQKILDNMDKRIKVNNMVNIYKMTQKIGLEPVLQYMYGYIGENDESLSNSVNFFKDIDHPATGFYTQAIPGTALYNHCQKEGLIRDEKKYLETFIYGYNKMECMINLSDYHDLETLNRKVWEARRKINKIYYRRHPIKFAQKLIAYYQANKGTFFKKILRQVFNRWAIN